MSAEAIKWDDTEEATKDWELDPTVRNGWSDPEDITEALEQQRKQCASARCKLIGFRGCVLEGILSGKAKLMLAQPCSSAVSNQPARQRL